MSSFFKQYASDAKILKLKMKWQNLYVPDLNNVFVNPSPDSVFKLLDRIVIVRSGYSVGFVFFFCFFKLKFDFLLEIFFEKILFLSMFSSQLDQKVQLSVSNRYVVILLAPM